MVAQPHYLLFCNTHFNDGTSHVAGGGRWHFVLEQLDGTERLEAADSEPALNRERLALLSVVRGLEALEQPSQVTLVTTSRYVDRGLRYGLSSWRDADYMWERFGEQRPVRNSDLWRRIDAALQFHAVKCRLIQAAQPTTAAVGPVVTEVPTCPLPSWPISATPVVSQLRDARSELPRERLDHDVSRPALLPHPQSAARHVPHQAARTIWLPPAALTNLTVQWWSLAAAWLRWWRGRLQAKPAFYAT